MFLKGLQVWVLYLPHIKITLVNKTEFLTIVYCLYTFLFHIFERFPRFLSVCVYSILVKIFVPNLWMFSLFSFCSPNSSQKIRIHNDIGIDFVIAFTNTLVPLSKFWSWACYSCSMSWADIARQSPSLFWSATCLNSELSFFRNSLPYQIYCSRKNFVCLARNLIWLLGSTHIFTQSGWLILFRSDHFSGPHQIGEKPPNTLFLRSLRTGQT